MSSPERRRLAAWTGGLLVLLAAQGLGRAFAQEADKLPRSLSDQEPSKPPQDPVLSRRQELEERPDETSFYPLPNIATGKNEGWTYGVLGALLLPDEHGDINKVVSFSVAYRDKVGVNGFADYRWTLSPNAVFEAYSYWAAKVENENQVFYDNRRLWDDYNFRFDFDEKRVGTERFFGRGISTKKNAESAYTSNNYLTQARFGPYLSENLSLQGTFRFRHFRAGESVLPKLPQMLDLFPDEYGIGGGEVFAEGLRLFYDTRNNIFTPTQGELAVVYFENAHFLSGGVAVPFQAYGIEGQKLWPHGDDAQFVFVGHLKAQFVVGHAPFWELSTLGGGSSLRSFGPNRFTDNDAWVINLEERIRLLTLRVESVTGEVQVAPFVDFGEVFRHTQDVARYDVDRRLHWSVGSGFRAVVHPYIVGRMDVGYGSEGLGITIGLDYPF
jgi:outer membrane protein assembly factor BamA